MQNKLARSKRKILDQKISHLQRTAWPHPKNGWVKAVRESLGITTSQLGDRMKIPASNISILEKREVSKKTTLETLEKAARAMGCKFVYAFVPETTFENIVREQALKAAKNIIQEVHHHMTLEKQKVSSEIEKEQIQDLAEEIISKMDSRLWQKEK